nr:tetratricopeptide repeat protein [Azospirillum oleiclasticum]
MGLVSLPVIALSALFGYAVFFDVDSVQFHNIEVPASLEYQGYTPQVVASRLAQQVKHIKEEARTARQMSSFSLPDEESPIQQLGRYYNFLTPIVAAQELLGLVEYSVFGDMVKTKSGLTLTVHGLASQTGKKFSSVRTGDDPEALIRQVALDTTRFIDPYIVASYQYERTVAEGGADFTSTIQELKNCVHALPESDLHWVHNLWGLVNFQTKRYDDAVEQFDLALKKSPGFVLPVYNIARVQAAKGEHEAAIATLRKVLEMDSKTNYRTPHAYTLWADLMVTLGQPDQAQELYQKAIKAGPEYGDAYANYGKLLRTQGKTADARILFGQALRLDPRRQDIRQNLDPLTQ